MKRRVNLSTYSVVLSAAVLVVLLVTLYYTWSAPAVYAIGACLLLCLSLALIYMPMSVSVDDKELSVDCLLRKKTIPLSEISAIELKQPTMGEKRICGSGGWFGYWGWFSERDLGKYFAYYGKASDCFFIRLKDGRRYMLGCEDPWLVVDFIRKRIS